MNKEKAISLYKKAMLEERAGAGILGTSIEHVYYEVVNYLEENNWLKEAEEELNRVIKKKKEELAPILENYYNFLLSGKEDKELLEFFKNKLYNFNIKGDEEEIILFRVKNNGKEPSKKELKELLLKRHEEDENNLKDFLQVQVRMYFEEPFDETNLKSLIKKLKEHGLLKKAIRQIPDAITSEELDRIYKN